MLGNITKKSGKSFLLRPFCLGRKKKVFVNFPYEIFAWQLDVFQGALKIVNLLISSFSHFLPNDDVVVVVFGVRCAVAFFVIDILKILPNIFTRADTDKYVLFL